jgi:hypothetical protein
MIELISIHIPKTAGSSLFQLLKKAYGKTSVLKINIPDPSDGQEIISDEDIDEAQVIHGHLRISDLQDIILKNDPKIITWLRDPVERVISNYYFSMQRIRAGKARDSKIHTINFSLPEYASLEENRNRASWFLDGIRIHELFFIGLTEYFNADIRELGRLLNWPEKIEIPHRKSSSAFIKNNNCATRYSEIDKKMKEEIGRLNSLDVDLYREVLALRNKI